MLETNPGLSPIGVPVVVSTMSYSMRMSTVPLLMIESILWFWILGAALGIFFGPVQSASRSLMARMTPAGMENEMFGLFALSGKVTAFVGPWLVGFIALTYDSQRIALATVIPFLVIGGLLLLTVREPDRPEKFSS